MAVNLVNVENVSKVYGTRALLDGISEVESERGSDIRRELARTIVNQGWGLLDLRPMRMSLEEVFLQVTTEERPEESAPDVPGGATGPADPGTHGPTDPRTQL